MEDIFKFLLVVGFIAIGIVKQYKKEADKNAKPDAPVPDLTGNDTTYGGYIPEGPQKPQKARKAGKKGKAKAAFQTPGNSTHSAPPPTEPQESEEASEFSIRSAEEARKAIIWSEILQRKY
ncbi:hypothetical protein [Bacteroides sp.]|uniref:hypothetical protein n=1 Tax=Bacteroides sp. TaxID=29523 RepID=UPI0023C72AFA|nr:hypothetical protein [Bacteroides sp.]MDE5711591.1 hypothetical protein [Bacteroides sp.]MDE6215928.1 hypothetical protein [Bacteroides sp.]